MNQRQFIHKFAENHRPKFNKKIFTRSDDEIVNHLINLIKSCQREMSVGNYFTIRIEEISIIDDYQEVNRILQRYQEININKSSKLKGVTDNRYDYNLPTSI